MAETDCWDTPGELRAAPGYRHMYAASVPGGAPRHDPMHGWCTARQRRAAPERLAAGAAGSDPESEPRLLCAGVDTARAFCGLPAPGQRRRHLRGNVPNPASAGVHAAIRNPPLSGSTAMASTPTLPSATRLRHAWEDPAAAVSGRPGLAMLAGDVPGPPVLAWYGSGSRRGAPCRAGDRAQPLWGCPVIAYDSRYGPARLQRRVTRARARCWRPGCRPPTTR